MVMRVPLQSIMVQRDGKMVRPPIGKSFKFNDDELADIMRMNPKALGKIEAVEIDDNAEATKKAAAEKAAAEAKLLADREEAQRQLDLKKSAAAAAPAPAGKGKGTAGADSL